MAGLRTVTVAMVVGGLFGTVAVGGLALVGCGGDSSSSPTDDGAVDSPPDGTRDSAPDVRSDRTADSPPEAEGPDSPVDSTTDATRDGVVDSPATDSAMDAPGDVRNDRTVEAGPTDAGPDSDAANAADSADASASDAMVDAGDADAMFIPPGLLAYPRQYSTAFCTGIANCCGLDAGSFDFTTCETEWSVGGYRGLPSILPAPDVSNRGNLTFDAARAAACVAAVGAWPCGTFDSAANTAIITACLNVMGGTIPIGSTGCMSSFECVSGAYCNVGTCTALVAQGGACTLDEQCTYVGTLQPALACDLYPDDGGMPATDGGMPATGTCQPQRATGASSFCYNGSVLTDLICSSQLCDDTTSTCGTTATNPWGLICASYTIPPG